MTRDALKLGAALAAGATPAHILALRNVRDVGSMWRNRRDVPSADRAAVTRQLWAWRAVESVDVARGRRRHRYLQLTPIGTAILFARSNGAHDDARTTQCA